MAQRAGPHRYEFELGKRDYSFSATVDAFVQETNKRLLALQRESLQRVVDDAQTPVAKGGRMRVDTGFLRASGQASLNGMPSGPDIKPKEAIKHQFDDGTKPIGNLTLVLSEMQLGATFFFGWTANYARYREAYDAFLYGAIQKWPQIVNSVCEEIKRRSPKGK